MARDTDKSKRFSRGSRGAPPRGGRGKRDEDRPAPARTGGKGFGGKTFGAKRTYGGARDEARSRDDRPRGDRPFRAKRDDGRTEDRRPRPDRFERGDRPVRGGDRPERGPRKDFGARKDFGPRKDAGAKRPFKARGERGELRRDDDRPRAARKPREFERGRDRGDEKPWQAREPRSRDTFSRDRDARPPRDERRNDTRGHGRPARDDAGRGFDRPRFRKSDGDRDRRGDDNGRPSFDRSRREEGERPRFRRPREDEAKRDSAWQDHPRSEARRDRFADRPRRDNEDDSRVFVKRPAFGGRGAYRERKPDRDKRESRPEPQPKKAGERIAKLIARAGLASRRDAEEWVKQGRVQVNGRVINSPALDVTGNDRVLVDDKPLPERERTRLFLYHKPRGLMTTHSDPEGRPTVFDNLPEDLPRLISIGRLDFNTEGLLLLTNDGGLARILELPDTGWLRRYRVRAHGEVTQPQLDALRGGVEVEGVKYGAVDATLEREQGSNAWITIAIREGKNREVRNILGHLGLEVTRLIRISYGPFQLGELAEGAVEEVRSRVLREQLGDRVVQRAGAAFDVPLAPAAGSDAPHPKKPSRGVIADRKGRRVLVQRAGGDESRTDDERGHKGPRRPTRGYHGKRDRKPRD